MNDELINGNTIGERLRSARKIMRLTQSDAAYLAGVPQSTISTYEADRSTPMAKQLTALCELYQVSPSYIMTGSFPTSGENSFDKSVEKELSPQTTRLINTVRNMEEDQISLVVDLAEAVKKHSK